jgi:hypothetical protein
MTSQHKQTLHALALCIGCLLFLVLLLVNETTRQVVIPLMAIRGIWRTSGDLATFSDWITRDTSPPKTTNK